MEIPVTIIAAVILNIFLKNLLMMDLSQHSDYAVISESSTLYFFLKTVFTKFSVVARTGLWNSKNIFLEKLVKSK